MRSIYKTLTGLVCLLMVSSAVQASLTLDDSVDLEISINLLGESFLYNNSFDPEGQFFDLLDLNGIANTGNFPVFALGGDTSNNGAILLGGVANFTNIVVEGISGYIEFSDIGWGPNMVGEITGVVEEALCVLDWGGGGGCVGPLSSFDSVSFTPDSVRGNFSGLTLPYSASGFAGPLSIQGYFVVEVQHIDEPASFFLLGLGLAGFCLMLARRYRESYVRG